MAENLTFSTFNDQKSQKYRHFTFFKFQAEMAKSHEKAAEIMVKLEISEFVDFLKNP